MPILWKLVFSFLIGSIDQYFLSPYNEAQNDGLLMGLMTSSEARYLLMFCFTKVALKEVIEKTTSTSSRWPRI